MILISHRGNIYGPKSSLENTEGYIEKARQKYFVEIDVWKIKDSWWLGHDGPEQKTSEEFISQKGLLLHAKNLDAFKTMLDLELHCFWHQEDFYTLTSRGLIISYPGYAAGSNVICMKPELLSMDTIVDCYAVCSDYVGVFGQTQYANKVAGFNETR